MTDDFKVRIASELDRLKRSLEGLIQYIGTTPLSQSDREDLIKRVRVVTRVIDESPAGTGERFNLLPRYLYGLKQDVELLSLTESDRQELLLYIRSIEEPLQNIGAILWELKLPVLIAHFEYLWTTEKDDWWLIEVENRDGKIGYDIHQVSKDMSLIIEDDECDSYVIEKMKEAGNRHVTLQEYAALFPMDLSEGLTFAPPAQASNSPDPTEPDNTEH